MEGNIPADVIVILAIAAYVVFKYRKILGEKTGHDMENTPIRGAGKEKEPEERVVPLHPGHTIEAEAVEVKDESLEQLEQDNLKDTIEGMKDIDASFTLDGFLSGAKGAFEMLMEAFNGADKATLKMLLSDELYQEFEQELKRLDEKKQSQQTTLVSILKAELADASLEKSQASVTIRFLSEQIQVLKDVDGKVVEGDASRIEQVEDEWVFERNLKSRNPNWTIADM